MPAPTERIAIIDDESFDAHRAPGPHPERPERLTAARQGLASAVPVEGRLVLPATAAEDDALARVHSPQYLSRLRTKLGERSGFIDPDTYFAPGTLTASLRAAGGAVRLVHALLEGEAKRGIALLRPPGHHARPTTPMGFCFLNNIAVAAAAALANGAKKVAIVDWDVHHGNGTQEMFYDDPRVLFVSLHQWPLYPGTGRAEEVGGPHALRTTANLPLPADSGPEAYGEAFRTVVLPLLRGFGPDVILVSAGFDAHARDPLAGLSLDALTFGAMTTALVREAEHAGHGRVGVFLEGGYDLQALEDSTAMVCRALRGEELELSEDQPREVERSAVARTRSLILRHAEGR